MSSAFDMIVVGVGAMGSAVCYQLARRGVRVLGLEQFDIPHALGSSTGHTRMIRLAYYEHPDYVPLLKRSYDLWRNLEHASGESLLFETGGIYMGPPDGEVVAGATMAAKLHGLAHETLSREELAKRFDVFTVPDNFTGVWEPRAGFLLAEKCVAAHALCALKSGAEIHGREAVIAWSSSEKGVTVRTSRGEYHAGRLIFCGGAWTDQLVCDLGVPLVVTRQSLAWVWPQIPARFEMGKFPVWGVEQPDGSLAYGFPMLGEVPGLKIARHGKGTVTDPDAVNRSATAEDEAEIRSIVRNYLPRADGPVLSLRTCLYTNSPDSHFIVDAHPVHPNVTLACGFSGHGFKFASVMGEVLADLEIEGKSNLPMEFLGLRRFDAKSRRQAGG